MKKIAYFLIFICLLGFNLTGAENTCDSREFKKLTLCEEFLEPHADIFEEAIFSDEALRQITEIVQAEVDNDKGYYNRYYLYMLLILRGKIMKSFLGADDEICEKYGPVYRKSSTKMRVKYEIKNATEEGVINVLIKDLNLGIFAKARLYCKEEYDKALKHYNNGDPEKAELYFKRALAARDRKKLKDNIFYYLHRIYNEKACSWDWEDCKLEEMISSDDCNSDEL